MLTWLACVQLDAIAARMAINTFRWLRSEANICGFREHPELMDIEAFDPFAEERLHRIATQLTAALILKVPLRQRGIDTGSSMDLTAGWNFDIKADRDRALKTLEMDPEWVTGSPPCTVLSTLHRLYVAIRLRKALMPLQEEVFGATPMAACRPRVLRNMYCTNEMAITAKTVRKRW